MKKRTLIIPLLLILATQVILFLRVGVGGVDLSAMYPEIDYLVELELDMDLHGEPVEVTMQLPANNEFQTTRSEQVETTHLSYSTSLEDQTRLGRWTGVDLRGHEVGIYRVVVDTHPQRFEITDGLERPEDYPEDLVRYLLPSETIQSGSEEIRSVVEELFPGFESQRPDLATTVMTAFSFVHERVETSAYEHSVDAITALRWREAHCGGKTRLLVALLRASGVPARPVVGLLLDVGSVRRPHMWAEAWVNGAWIPFDALRGLAAEHPADHLVLHRGDRPLVTYDRNINFKYLFKVKKWRRAPEEASMSGATGYFNAYVLWEKFRKAHISLNLLRIILMLPIGVLVVILFRNIIGLRTFGTFMPALLAVALRDTGLAWGLSLFLGVIVLGLLVRYVLDFVPMLHTPRLGLVLMFVIVFMLTVTYVSVQVGVLEPAHITMFPIAILALTVESCYLKFQELGARETGKIIVATLLVSAVAHIAMEHPVCQAVVFVFPETLLTVAAAYILLGRYVGLRIVELHRFRWLLIK